ncbi:MAG: carboxypeptidase regulatory-like domain-containing protein, partial [Terracidiphilus sp.]
MSIDKNERMMTARSERRISAWAPGLFFLPLLLVFFASAIPAKAQLDTGSISGTILDPAGKVVQAARVSIVGEETGTTYSTASSSSGSYFFPSVRPGK